MSDYCDKMRQLDAGAYKVSGDKPSEQPEHPVTVLFYLMLRDHIPLGAITSGLKSMETDASILPSGKLAYQFTNQPLLALARSLSDRLRKLEEVMLESPKPPTSTPDSALPAESMTRLAVIAWLENYRGQDHPIDTMQADLRALGDKGE